MEHHMIIEVKKFGEVLSSRSAGREAALVTLSYFLKNTNENSLEIDFKDVLVMTPSWLSEYVQTLNEKKQIKIKFLESDNPSVISSIEIIEGEI